jgi:hypothetical protein
MLNTPPAHPRRDKVLVGTQEFVQISIISISSLGLGLFLWLGRITIGTVTHLLKL